MTLGHTKVVVAKPDLVCISVVTFSELDCIRCIERVNDRGMREPTRGQQRTPKTIFMVTTFEGFFLEGYYRST